ncbi:uncharacterized protein LOC141680019 [Apium graveolens]|uniref:uncharacterized protein LOC141680019 n=1 Tax=Apium graveolens TaxID=4045 RepID=UPI003D7A1D34
MTEKDGKLRHPAYAEARKTMDAKFPYFAEDDRNVRLGLASDGFSPYRTMSTTHSTWPIVLVNYNLPPWLCMKPENLLLSMIISGPESPRNSIDVFMQPLIAELKDLWDKGIETYDALAGENFNLCASIYGPLAIFWGTQCYPFGAQRVIWAVRKFLELNHKWRFDKKRFNGEIEMGMSPSILSGLEVEELLTGFQNQYGGAKSKKKEKNLYDSILGTLLNMCGKSKDHLNSRFDLQEMGIRKDLHPFLTNDGKAYEIRAVIFDMTNKEKETFCAVLENAKLTEHRALIEGQARPKRFKRERVHTDDFYKWLQEQVGKKEVILPELQVLSKGPNRVAKQFSGYVINGFRFHTKFRDARCITQNSGVFLSALTTSFASSKDENPLVSEVNYYGRIEEILEIDYWGEISVVLFKCCWYQEETDLYGLIRVNFSKLCQKSDPYVLASQVQQVYYLQDPVDKSYDNVIKKLPRDWSEVESPDAKERPDANESPETVRAGVEVSDVHWCRDDAPIIEIPVTEEEENAS